MELYLISGKKTPEKNFVKYCRNIVIQFHDYFLGLWLQIVVPDFGKDRVFFYEIEIATTRSTHIFVFAQFFFHFRGLIVNCVEYYLRDTIRLKPLCRTHN